MRAVVVEAAARSDVGRLRQSNEDALLVDDPVYAVADGMGGARAGEVASAMAVAALHGVAGDAKALQQAIRDVNARIHAAAGADALLAGMGTTVTALVLVGEEVAIGHVGDSRAYLFRDHRLTQLTDDHSLVGELVRRGALDPSEAERHPQRSVITRALGAEDRVDIDAVQLHPQTGDIVLLCSDGLTGMVHDAEIERILGSAATLAEAADRLIHAANAAGGEDNISAVLLRLAVQSDDDTATPAPAFAIEPTSALELQARGSALLLPTATPSPRRGRGVALGVAIAALGVVVAVGVVLGLQWAHFVDATPDGRIAIYQGLPIELTDDVTLYRVAEVTDLAAGALTPAQRRDVLDRRIGSQGAAQERVDALTASSPWLAIPPASR